MQIPNSIGVRNDEAFQEAHAGEIVALHDVNNAPGYTKASIDVSELVSTDSVQVSKVSKDLRCQA
ncbi:hypothetical protein MtrunA17_Chr2g0291411 [Medicago truncatula]|uniref:Uncharacterized protein n=1 Tax=Medicago truncatula TaxID=3880 RepID=A0A396J791_MEDTR|nr:hypothetical protein MtrunA17_Chr2g0291411 [Medicago truncatula]